MSPVSPFAVFVLLAAASLSLRPVAAHPSARRTEIQAHNSRLAGLSSESDPAGQRKRLLDIDWAALRFDSDADALKVWRQIAPTGADWERKLDEVPGDLRIPQALALAMIRAGGFQCAPVRVATCDGAATGIPPPVKTSTLVDPCLRRRLTMWSFDRLDAGDIPKIRDALRMIVQIPPPETELVALALRALPESDSAGRYELLELAWKAGHRELVNSSLGTLPERYLIDAVQRLRIDGAIDMLSPEKHRAVFVRAIRDEKLKPAARAFAINQVAKVSTTLSPELRALLIAATRHRDCALAAAAARALEIHGDRSFIPLRPTTNRVDEIMRSLCVLANYQILQDPGDAPLLETYVPPRGLELARGTYDPYNPRNQARIQRSLELIPRSFAKLPEISDVRRAFERCSGSTCTSSDRTYKFVLRPHAGALALWRIEVTDRVPCTD